MAENTRGQNGQKKKMEPSGERQQTSFGNDRRQSTTRGLTDIDAEPLVGRQGGRGARNNRERNFTDSYFDGRLSDE